MVRTRSVSPGATMSRAARSSIRRYSAQHRANLRPATGRAVRKRHLLARGDEVVDPVRVRQQLLAGGVDVGRGLADGVHDVRVVLDRGSGGTDARSLVVQVRGQG